MTALKTLPLGELVLFRSGKAVKPGGEGPYAVFGSNGLIGRSTEFLYRNAIILGRVGAYCGSVAYCAEPFWASDNTIVVEPNQNAFDTRFAYYALTHANLARWAGGAAQPLITQTVLKGVELRIPPLEDQRQIADILSAYDDLIEVNTRRIAILEEMARRLFDEWMHEAQMDGTVADTLPVAELVTGSLGGDWGDETAQGDNIVEVRVIRGTDLPDLVRGNFDRCPTRYISTKSYERRTLLAGDLIVENSINAKSRAAGTPFLATKSIIKALGGRAVAASFCRVFKTRASIDAAFLLSDMKRLHKSRDIERFQVVAANGIANFQTQRFLAEHFIKVPRDPVRKERLGKLLLDLNSSVLSGAIGTLRAARELLLPKLISGQIDLATRVQDVEITTKPVAAE